MWCDAKALIHSVNPSLPRSWNEISAIGRTDVKAAFPQVENALEKMFLASIAHLLQSDIQISNGQQQELALNFSAAYYSALSGKCWPERERATSWSSYSFSRETWVNRQTILYRRSHKSFLIKSFEFIQASAISTRVVNLMLSLLKWH